MRNGFMVMLLAMGLVFPAGMVKAADTVVSASEKKIKFDYTLTVDNEVVETTTGKTPLEYTPGKGQLIPGLEKEMEGMKPGDTKTVVVKPEDGYGMPKDDGVREYPLEKFPQGMEPQVGMVFEMQDEGGNSYPATIKEIKDKIVILDFNHPLAGKELTFEVKVVSIE
ncbi:MAG: peptidylprolyl isomerase [Candidatus Omnitrophica bacterium]|nr:peptidylprolyl isomerase [Candidatus Omnitrophota bacterium]